MPPMPDKWKILCLNLVESIAFENFEAYSSGVFLTIESPASLKSLAGLSDAGLFRPLRQMMVGSVYVLILAQTSGYGQVKIFHL
jgi:hypothetical protein